MLFDSFFLSEALRNPQRQKAERKTPCQLSCQRGPPKRHPTGWLQAPSPVALSLVNLHVSCNFHRLKLNPITTRMPSVLSKLNRNWTERLIPGNFSYRLALRWPDKAASTEGSAAVCCGFMKIFVYFWLMFRWVSLLAGGELRFPENSSQKTLCRCFFKPCYLLSSIIQQKYKSQSTSDKRLMALQWPSAQLQLHVASVTRDTFIFFSF